MASQPRIVVGVISDTHGLLRPEAVAALHGSDLIIHAGDVGDPEVLDRLREIAPTFAVRGNVDTSSWAQALPLTDVVEAGRVQCYVLHNLLDLGLDPKAAGFAVVIAPQLCVWNVLYGDYFSGPSPYLNREGGAFSAPNEMGRS